LIHLADRQIQLVSSACYLVLGIPEQFKARIASAARLQHELRIWSCAGYDAHSTNSILIEFVAVPMIIHALGGTVRVAEA
jgi:hypothetical protein